MNRVFLLLNLFIFYTFLMGKTHFYINRLKKVINYYKTKAIKKTLNFNAFCKKILNNHAPYHFLLHVIMNKKKELLLIIFHSLSIFIYCKFCGNPTTAFLSYFALILIPSSSHFSKVSIAIENN